MSFSQPFHCFLLSTLHFPYVLLSVDRCYFKKCPMMCPAAQWIGPCSINQKVAGSTPHQGTCLGYWLGPHWGCVRDNRWMFLSLSFSFPSPLSKNVYNSYYLLSAYFSMQALNKCPPSLSNIYGSWGMHSCLVGKTTREADYNQKVLNEQGHIAKHMWRLRGKKLLTCLGNQELETGGVR